MKTKQLIAPVCMLSAMAYAGDALAAQPNFVIMIADDCSHYDWGVYGRAYAQQYGNRYGNTEAGITPNIDRFAEEAMKFNRCFQQAPTSSPTRHALYTGLHSVHSGAYPNHTYAYDHVQSFVQYFRPAGYETALAWKEHVEPKSIFAYEYLKNANDDGVDFNSTKYDDIKNFMGKRKNDGKPFFLVVASNEPHEPYNRGDHTKWNPDKINIPEGYPDTPETREMLCRYYAEINVFDTQVGNILRILDQNGMKENTVVMLLSEQGNSMPFAKWTCYRNGLQSAMLVRWPGHIQPGSETNALVNYIDVVPTFMDIAGLAAPDTDGKSFYKVLKGESDSHAKYSFGQQTSRGIHSGPEWYGIRSVKDGKYNYIVNLDPEAEFKNTTTGGNKAYKSWKTKGEAGDAFALARYNKYRIRPAEELYDMEADPWELKNLANDPAYAAKKAELKAALEAWMAEMGDEGQATEMKALERMWKNAAANPANVAKEKAAEQKPAPRKVETAKKAAKGWVKVTENKADWSGTYLVVFDSGDNDRLWDLTLVAKEQKNLFVTIGEDCAIKAAGTTKDSKNIALKNLDKYTVTIAKTKGGYSICTAKGDYITNTTGKPGIVAQKKSVAGANSIELDENLNVRIHLDNAIRFSYFKLNRVFNYLPAAAWAGNNERVYPSLYEYVAE